MQIVEGKRIYNTRSFSSLIEMLRQSTELHGDKSAYMFRRKPRGKILTRTYSELVANIEELGTALIDMGLQGERIALAGENCYEWVVTYYAVVSGVGVIVPLDKLLPAGELISLLKRSHSRVFVFTPALMDVALQAKEEVESLEYLICMNEVSAKPLDLKDKPEEHFYRFTSLIKRGAALLDDGDTRFLKAEINENEMCTLLFTSGTTSIAKGVMLSQKNLVSNAAGSVAVLEVFPGERALSVLPLHHSFEQMAGMIVMLYFGTCICFTDGLRYLAENLVEWRINVMLGVPLLMTNIYKRIHDKIEKSGKSGIVNALRPIGRGLSQVGFQTNRKLFKSILDGLGGGLRLVVTGAAAMDKDVIQAFLDFGVTFFQGYGLTESSPVVACCNMRLNIPGTIGPPIYGCTVKIDSENPNEPGEILTKSDSVMLGYFEEPELTAEAIDRDGWLHTGDMGFIDNRGAIHITGRFKSMIVLTNGKKAFPEEIEFLINNIPGIKESMSWGERNAREAVDICAKLQFDFDELTKHAGTDPDQRSAWIKEQIARVNEQMPEYKKIKYFIYTDQDFIRTTTLKVRRFEELDSIHAWLEKEGKSMKEADGAYQGA